MEEFQLESCVRGHHAEYTRVRGLRCWGKYFLRLRGLTFNATLDFSICFLKILLCRSGRLARYLPRECTTCRSVMQKKTYTKPFCLYTFRLHFAFVQWLNDIDKILADIKFGGN